MSMLLRGALLAVAALVAVVLYRAASMTPPGGLKHYGGSPRSLLPDDAFFDAAIQRLSKAIQIETVSMAPKQGEAQGVSGTHHGRYEDFDRLIAFLEEHYPLINEKLEREDIGCHTRLWKWEGSDKSLRPFLLLAHLDVVPIETGTEDAWTHPPFAGVIADGFLWGRGTLDDKGHGLAVMEAVENLLAKGFVPRRTMYLVFGHDEEIGGTGANAVANMFETRGVRLEYVLDEGGSMISGALPIARPVGLVGIAEKGYVTLQLESQVDGGHSSMPPPESAIGLLSKAVAAVEANPFPPVLNEVVTGMFAYIGHEMPFVNRVFLANLWLFGPLVKMQFQQKPSTNAQLATTIAVTMIRGGNKENVLPTRATAAINFRVGVGETIQGVMEHVTKSVGDSRVKVDLMPGAFGKEASRVSSTASYGWQLVTGTISQRFTDVCIAPYLVMGATDGRHFETVSDSVYRFSPFKLTVEDLPRIHGVNERLSLENYRGGIQFFVQLIKNSQSAAGEPAPDDHGDL